MMPMNSLSIKSPITNSSRDVEYSYIELRTQTGKGKLKNA